MSQKLSKHNVDKNNIWNTLLEAQLEKFRRQLKLDTRRIFNRLHPRIQLLLAQDYYLNREHPIIIHPHINKEEKLNHLKAHPICSLIMNL